MTDTYDIPGFVGAAIGSGRKAFIEAGIKQLKDEGKGLEPKEVWELLRLVGDYVEDLRDHKLNKSEIQDMLDEIKDDVEELRAELHEMTKKLYSTNMKVIAALEIM